MNRINELQNGQTALEELTAQRHLYSQAKQILFCRGLLALVIAVVFPFITEKYSGASFWLAFFALVYFSVDMLFLKNAESQKKDLAAKIQEQFDTGVLDIRWNMVVAGEKPDHEDVKEHSEKSFDKEVTTLRDWYAPRVAQLPVEVARLVCQRTNVWWDSKLRRIYADSLLALLIILSVVLIFLIKNKTVADAFVLLAPFAPLWTLLAEQYGSHRETANRVDKLKIYLSGLLQDFVVNPTAEINELVVRSVQDEIYRHRSSATPIPNCFYKIFRKKYESQMGFSADKFVDNYLATTGTSTTM